VTPGYLQKSGSCPYSLGWFGVFLAILDDGDATLYGFFNSLSEVLSHQVCWIFIGNKIESQIKRGFGRHMGYHAEPRSSFELGDDGEGGKEGLERCSASRPLRIGFDEGQQDARSIEDAKLANAVRLCTGKHLAYSGLISHRNKIR
jgi:hypothetical protein